MSSTFRSKASARCRIRLSLKSRKVTRRELAGYKPRAFRPIREHGSGGAPMKTTQVLIAGGGPVGLMLAKVLTQFGVKVMVVERNTTTTRYPKMRSEER